METIYVVKGSQDGNIGAFLTMEAAIECAVDYVEQNGATAVVRNVEDNYAAIDNAEEDLSNTADVYALSTNYNPIRAQIRKKKDAVKTIKEKMAKANSPEMTPMQKRTIDRARSAAVMMSTDKFPMEIAEEKIESDKCGLWLTMDVRNTGATKGSYLDMIDHAHWFIHITRRGKATIHQGPHWANKGTNGMHAAKDGYFS
jgi:hypothetical protein